MNRILTLAALALVACEGEPPKTPAGATAIAPPEAPTGAEPSPTTPAATPAANCAGCCCNAADGGAGEAGTEVVAPVAPAPATPSKITGVVTAVPKAAAANAVVYLEDAPIEPSAKLTAQVDNRTMTFVPFVSVVPAGGRVVFHNSDPFPHNVFSPDADKFNMGTISQGQTLVHTFKKGVSYSLLCNLHPGMLGYLVVSPSSYFSKADSHGRYAISDVPAGTYKVTAWAPRQTPVTQSVTVKVGSDAAVDFDLHR